jgi:uncharacterized protein YqjF (DUF2071 family)
VADRPTDDANGPGTTPRPWVWSQHWQDLLFLHWRADPEILRGHVPAPLEVATHRGDAWVSLVLFRLRVRPRWLPFLPGVSALVEVNLRTYVHWQGRPGIWFLSVHADNRWAIRLARLLTPIPYTEAALRYRRRGGRFQFEARPGGPAGPRARLTFLPTGPGSAPRAQSLDEWLLERYRLFAGGGGAGLVEAEVAHPRWVVQPVEVSGSAGGFGRALGLDLACAPALAHYAPGVRARFGAFRLVNAGGPNPPEALRVQAGPRAGSSAPSGRGPASGTARAVALRSGVRTGERGLTTPALGAPGG